MSKQRIASLVGLGALFAVLGAALHEPAPETRAERGDQPVVQQSQPRTPGPAAAPSPALAADSQAAWVERQVMVSVADPLDLKVVADELGLSIVRAAGPSGLGALAVPEGEPLEERLAVLAEDPRVTGLAPQGRIVGAARPSKDGGGKDGGGGGKKGGPGSGATIGHPAQWHLAASVAPADAVPGVVVAVVDTGVAFEDHTEADGTVHAPAPSLVGSSIVAPWDFVNGDAHPGDDHQHGTHIASVIASNGAVAGVAPEAALMPLKVLDAQNQGLEIDLIAAIHHAVDNGADVINMSLSFGPGYLPSRPLVEALQRAHDSGVVMVAAAGNAALDQVSWPAASPLVLSVGSTCPGASGPQLASYANRSLKVDVVAPGGCMDQDSDGDGYPDGVLAETIVPGDPSQTGLWFMAGTSQAAAVVSGGVAHLLQAGADPADILSYLQYNTTSDFGSWPWESGVGAGGVDLTRARNEATWADPALYAMSSYHVALLPSLVYTTTESATPRLRVSVLDQDLQPATDVTVWVRVRGSSEADFYCGLDAASAGQCDLWSPTVDLLDAGAPAPLSWSIEVVAVIDDGISTRPGALFFASDELESIVSAMRADAELAEDVIAFYWPDEEVDGIGHTVESYTVHAGASGAARGPSAMLFTPAALPAAATVEDHLDGSGISTSPFGFLRITFDGSGISTSPFGFTSPTLTAFLGSGISTSPFGAKQMFTLQDSTSGCLTCTFDGQAVTLSTSSVEDGGGSELQALVDDGGWVSGAGFAAPEIAAGSGSVLWQPQVVGVVSGTGASAMP